MSDRKLDMLRGIELLATCTEPELRAIAATADLMYASAGEVLRPAGGADRAFFLVLSGAATIGGDLVLARGMSDGALGLLDGEPEPQELRMVADGVVLVASPRQFNGLLTVAPGFAAGVARDLSRRLRARHRANTAVA